MPYFKIALMLLGLSALGYAWHLFTHGEDQDEIPTDQPIENVVGDEFNFGKETTLEEISPLWTTPHQGVYKFSEISLIWRPREEDPVTPYVPPVFKNPKIKNFWQEVIEDRSIFDKTNTKKLIRDLLHILDKEGDCPSVVDKNRHDSNVNYKQHKMTFEILQKVSLVDHSLRVARLAAAEGIEAVLKPKAIITALAHDIGKIPSVYDKFYSTGDHPALAIRVLSPLESFNNIKSDSRENVLKTILDHHSKRTGEDSGELALLRKCDIAAREAELSEFHQKTTQEQSPKPASAVSPVETYETSAVVPASPDPQPEEHIPAPMTVEDIITGGERKKPSNRVCTLSPPPEWFDEDKFRRAMRMRVNSLHNGNWQSVSMADGLVWFKYATLIEAIIEASDNSPSVIALASQRDLQMELIYSVLKACEDRCVDWGLVPEGFISTKCMWESGFGTTSKSPVHLTPVRANWFFTVPSSLEAEKAPSFKKMIAKIVVVRNQNAEDEK